LVVEDLKNLTDEANAYISSEGASSQVSFIGHDFFQPQPEQGRHAGVYFLSHIIHDWPDDKCRLILKHLVDDMGPGSRIVLCESILPEPGQLPEYQEALVRAQDLGMFSFLKARERTVDDLEALLKSVDSRLKVSRVIGPPEMKKNSLIEFAFDA
jgi:O-methyltransferase domain